MIKLADNSAARPDRLLSRLKINSIDESVPRLIVMRQPKGPDGKGFNNLARLARLPGKTTFFLNYYFFRLNLLNICISIFFSGVLLD